MEKLDLVEIIINLYLVIYRLFYLCIIYLVIYRLFYLCIYRLYYLCIIYVDV